MVEYVSKYALPGPLFMPYNLRVTALSLQKIIKGDCTIVLRNKVETGKKRR